MGAPFFWIKLWHNKHLAHMIDQLFPFREEEEEEVAAAASAVRIFPRYSRMIPAPG